MISGKAIWIKGIEEGIQERLLLEFPKRYDCIRGGNVNYTLLNLDVTVGNHK